jgi:hypothetical protein
MSGQDTFQNATLASYSGIIIIIIIIINHYTNNYIRDTLITVTRMCFAVTSFHPYRK